jgi:pimeloyl-ACP methyl ester carboxylesterase
VNIRLFPRAALCALALVVTGCSTTQNDSSTASTKPATTITWLPCGTIECGSLAVPTDHLTSAGPTTALALFRRKATVGSSPRTLLLLPDREFGDTARELVENSPLSLGITIRGYDVISVAARGSEFSPMSLGNEHRVGTYDSVNDMEAVRVSLGKEKVSVIGWGTGATIGTAWLMQKPSVIDVAVFDSPTDPTTSLVKQATHHIAATALGVHTAVRWCASHLSCPMNANVAKELNKLKTAIRLNRVAAGITFETVSRAALRSLPNGQPQQLFEAITDAIDGDGKLLLALAGQPPTADAALARCADVSQKSAAFIAAAHAAVVPYKFTIGSEAQLFATCANLPAAIRPLSAPEEISTKAQEARVLVTIARGDQIVAPYVARTMAKNMRWIYKSIYANRHLVVGYDQAATDAAMEFLAA